MTGGENPLQSFFTLSSTSLNSSRTYRHQILKVKNQFLMEIHKSVTEKYWNTVLYCAFLSFQEWHLPLLSGRNSVYWRKHLTSEHHSTREPVPVSWKCWKKNKQKTSPVREHNETPWFWIKCRRRLHETPPSLRLPFFQWFHIAFLTGTPCALYHVTNESLTKDHRPFRIFRVWLSSWVPLALCISNRYQMEMRRVFQLYTTQTVKWEDSFFGRGGTV